MGQGGVEKFLKRLRTTVSIEQAPNSGRLHTTRGIVRLPVSMLKADIFSITYDCYYLHKTRHILLSDSGNCTVLRAVVLTQYWHVTDGQTDRQTDRRTDRQTELL